MSNVGCLKRFVRDEEAQGTAEYGLVLAIIAIGLIAAVIALKDGLAEILGNLSTELSGATGGSG